MIHIDRDSVSKPAILDSPKAGDEWERAASFFELPVGKRSQKRFSFRLYKEREVRDALIDLFHGKCAFCESYVGDVSLAYIDHFRPMSRAMELDGTLFPDHYWWLGIEWGNLYLCCQTCNRMKGTRFPILGPRADIGLGHEELLAEEPLLLDPCGDYPEEYLVFNENGTVVSDKKRGRVTIEVLGLNRKELVEARRKEIHLLQDSWSSLRGYTDSGEPVPEELTLDALMDGAQPYAGLRRQFVAQWLRSAPASVKQRIEEEPSEAYTQEIMAQQKVLSQAERRDTAKRFQAFQGIQEDYSLEEQPGDERYFLRTRMIERIEIRNFRIIRDLTLDLSTSQSQRAPWLMLLGENGTGKSSVLQAVALALAGEKYRYELPISSSAVLRYRCKSGSVKVFLTGTRDPIELHFRKGESRFEGSHGAPKILLLGYGATRLLPRAGVQPAPGTRYAQVDNLFNPFVPLKNATEWLLERSDDEFAYIAPSLHNLLSLEGETRVVRHFGKSPRVEVDAFGTLVPLEQLSDGYQSVLALATDIMAVMLKEWKSMDVAEGLVLLDEIGAHLHPRWKMRIVKSLRQVFPRVQFVATTHNPLCLRGLKENEVVVMRRNAEDQIVALTDLPPVEGLRVDQLLTSEHFGLNSTVDPEIDAMFDDYYRLLALRKRSPQQNEQLKELGDQLSKYDLMGTTRREQLALEAIDQYLAQEPELTDLSKRSSLKDETRRTVSEIWSRLEREGGE